MKTLKKPANDSTAKWYIVGCRPQSERLASADIVALGQTVYVPCFRKEFHHRRQRKWIKRHYPLWPGYLLILASEHWPRVLDCEHVSRILRSQNFGEESAPIAIGDADVQAIRAAQDAGQFDDLRASRTGLQPGDMVKIREGLFSGTAGPVDTVGDDSIVMLITAMGRELRTIVPLENLAQAS
jgi:transcription antitermination factor NusG